MLSGRLNKEAVKQDEEASLMSASSKRCHPLSVAVGPIVAEGTTCNSYIRFR